MTVDVPNSSRIVGTSEGAAFPAVYSNTEDDVAAIVCGDDYLCSGPESSLTKLSKKLSEAFEIKTCMIGEDDHLSKETKILNRIIRVTQDGWEIEAGPRHGELIIKEPGLENSKGLTTPGFDEPVNDDDPELEDWRATKFRSVAARANHLALDRPDLQFAVKELCRSMSRPTEGSWRKLTRLGKYIIHRPRLVLHYRWQDPIAELSTFSDANWAGCLKSRKSTSGGVIKLGDHLLRSWSKTQTNIALSSAEREFYAATKAAQESLGMATMGRELSMNLKSMIFVDASAALGVAQRHGIGKNRHLQTGALWIQEQELKRVIRMKKVVGSENCSDILTNNVSREILEKHAAGMNMEYRGDRAEKAVQLHLIQRKVRQARAEINALEASRVRSKQDEPIRSDLIGEFVDNTDQVLRKSMMKSNDVPKMNINQYEKQVCRHEGSMVKWQQGHQHLH